MITIEVSRGTIAALDRRSKAVRDAIKKGSDRRKVLNRIKEQQNQRWDRNLASQGGEYGGWAALAGATIDDRVARGFGAGPILQRRGNLFNVTRTQAAGARINAASISWQLSDTGDTWGATHWTGYANVRGGAVPSRKVWDFDGEDEDRDAILIEEFFAELFEGM